MLLAGALDLNRRASATPQVSVFLAVEAERGEAAALEARLRAHPQVQELRFVPKEEALQRLKAREGLAAVIDGLPRNPLPDAFVLWPRTTAPDALEALRAELAGYPKVEYAQVDSAWARRLAALLELARTGAWLLAALLGVGLMAVTFNTIRVQVLAHAEEIELSRLLGATDAFIRRPYYYFGALQGLSGGLVAWGILAAAGLLLQRPAGELAGLYGLDFALGLPGARESLALLAAALLLGWTGAWFSLRRHLEEAARRDR
jgi:cell division transport system permease protein